MGSHVPPTYVTYFICPAVHVCLGQTFAVFARRVRVAHLGDMHAQRVAHTLDEVAWPAEPVGTDGTAGQFTQAKRRRHLRRRRRRSYSPKTMPITRPRRTGAHTFETCMSVYTRMHLRACRPAIHPCASYASQTWWTSPGVVQPGHRAPSGQVK